MTDRFYTFFISTYHTDIDIIKSFCDKTFKYAYALHDKDDKSPHYHIVCSFKRNLSYNQVRKMFPDNQNTFIEQCFDRYKSYEYLTHKNNPDKFQYSQDIISTNDKKYFINNKLCDNLERVEFLSDIEFKRLSEREMFFKYGRDYIKNRSVYKNFVSICIHDDLERERGYPDFCELIDYDTFLFHLSIALSKVQSTIEEFIELG